MIVIPLVLLVLFVNHLEDNVNVNQMLEAVDVIVVMLEHMDSVQKDVEVGFFFFWNIALFTHDSQSISIILIN